MMAFRTTPMILAFGALALFAGFAVVAASRDGDNAVIAVDEIEYPAGAVFPANLGELDSPCSSITRAQPVLDDFSRDWYSAHLLQAGEGPLANYAVSDSQINRQIRFIWLRSFHRPIVIRITQRENGRWQLNAVELNGAGGYEPGVVGRSIERELDDEEETGLLRMVDGAKLFEQPSLTCELGLDGARWIVEGIDREAYHFIDRWSPEQGPVHDFGLYALELTGWDVGEIY